MITSESELFNELNKANGIMADPFYFSSILEDKQFQKNRSLISTNITATNLINLIKLNSL